MNNSGSHFRLNSRQRNGIFLLISIILILQYIYFFVDLSPKEKINTETEDIQKFQNEIDSLKKIKNQTTVKIYPFNPNYLTDYKAYQLGMNVEEIDRLFAFRKKGKFINSAKEFQKVTLISDSLLQVMLPYFKFPEWVNQKEKKQNKKVQPVKKEDLNKVTEEQLQQISGIGSKLSKRIIRYRKLLQGFTFNDQIYEVYGLNRETAKKILNRFEVKNKPIISKLDINNATFKDILHTPYIDYHLTKKIVRYRDRNNGFDRIEDLKKIDSFPVEKFDRINLYLTVKN